MRIEKPNGDVIICSVEEYEQMYGDKPFDPKTPTTEQVEMPKKRHYHTRNDVKYSVWRKSEIKILKTNRHLSSRQLSKRLLKGRTPASIAFKKCQLGLTRTHAPRKGVDRLKFVGKRGQELMGQGMKQSDAWTQANKEWRALKGDKNI